MGGPPEVLPPEEQALARREGQLTVPDESAEQALEKAKQQINFWKGVLTLIAESIPPSQIVLYDEQPHFTAAACVRIMQWAGAQFIVDKMENFHWDGEEGPYIEFVVTGRVLTRTGRELPVMGNRSTNDDFFGTGYKSVCPACGADLVAENVCPTHNVQREPKRKRYQLPLKEVDIASVRQAAVSNAWNKAVAALGLLPAKEELEKAMGRDKFNSIRTVGFERGSKGGRQQGTDTADVAAQRKKIEALLQELGDNEREKMEAMLEAVTTFTGEGGKVVKGKRRVAELTVKQLPIVLERLSEMNAKAEAARKQGKMFPQEDKKPKSRTPSPAPSGKPIGTGIITSAKRMRKQGSTQEFIEIIQEGHKLFLFDNMMMRLADGSQVRLFELLLADLGATGLYAEFATKDQAGKDKQGSYTTIIGVTRLGAHEWELDGTPVKRWDPEAEAQPPAEITNEDVPF